jgi:hypothetical protein
VPDHSRYVGSRHGHGSVRSDMFEREQAIAWCLRFGDGRPYKQFPWFAAYDMRDHAGA